MIIYSKVTEAPANEPVLLSEAKAWLKVDGTDEDSIINALIIAARRMCEDYASLSFVTQTRQIKLDRFPCGFPYKILLPYGPVQEITSFTYVDSDGATTSLIPGTDYTANLHSYIASTWPLNGWPATKCIAEAVTIEYTAGYQNDPDQQIELQNRIPAEIKQAILMQIATLYENRQDEVSGSLNLIGWNSRTILDTVKVYWNANT